MLYSRSTVHSTLCTYSTSIYNYCDVKMHWSSVIMKELNIRKLLALRIYQYFLENDCMAFLNNIAER